MYCDPTTVTIPTPLLAWQAQLAERMDEGRRDYRTPSGAWLPSVTTILKSTQVDGPELAAWRARATPHELAETEALRDHGAERGRVVHDLVERFLVARQQGRRAEAGSHVGGPWWTEISPALRKVDRLHATELAVYSDELGTAGRLDCLATWIGTPAVVDWKTKRQGKLKPGSSKRYRPKREWLLHHHEQIAAYVAMLNGAGVLVGGEPIRAGVLVVAIEGDPRPVIHELGEADLAEALARFGRRLDQYYLGAA